MTQINHITPILLIILIAGCTSAYKIPEGAKTATLEISIKKPPFTGGSLYIYSVETQSCPSPKVSEIIEHYRPSETEVVTIAADKELHLRIKDNAGVGVGIPGYTCINGVKFNPAAGGRYVLDYAFDGEMCSSTIFKISHNKKTIEASAKYIRIKEAVDFCGK